MAMSGTTSGLIAAMEVTPPKVAAWAEEKASKPKNANPPIATVETIFFTVDKTEVVSSFNLNSSVYSTVYSYFVGL